MEEILSGRLHPEPGGEQRYVCVLFSDIRGYTARSEGAPPPRTCSSSSTATSTAW